VPPASVRSFDHIVLVIMENHSYGEIIGSSDAPAPHDERAAASPAEG